MKVFRKAFTLAEVLITLGIIGVVAAMTIPMFVKNYQNKVFTVQLKKDYAMLSQGFKMMLAEEQVDSLSQTYVFQSIAGNQCDWNNYDECADFYSGLGKYFKGLEAKNISNYTYYFLNNSNAQTYSGPAVIFNDGSMIYSYAFQKVPTRNSDMTNLTCADLRALNTNFCERQAYFRVDVNGTAKPNIIGRDIFWLNLSSDGMLYSYRGRDFSLFYTGTDSIIWQKSPTYGCNPDLKNVNGNGWGCSARIIENNWVMDY